MTCTFFGHRDAPPAISEILFQLIEELIQNEELATMTFNADAVFKANYLPDDLNGDCSVNLADVVYLLRYLLDYPLELSADADKSGDGRISIIDAVLLLRSICE